MESAALRFTERLPVPGLVTAFRKTNTNIGRPSWKKILRIPTDEHSATLIKMTDNAAIVMRKLATDQDEKVIIEKIEKLTSDIPPYLHLKYRLLSNF